jgi:hypothetical protein
MERKAKVSLLSRHIAVAGMVALGSSLLASVAIGQTKARDSEPRLPGAVSEPPAWLKDAPFDIAKFFEMPPPQENAAPLYLDAFYEFSPEMEMCFPHDQRQRTSIVRERVRRSAGTLEAFHTDPAAVPIAQVDATLAEFSEGFRKLEVAQRRPRCVFAIGLNYDAVLPHAQVARQVIRLLKLQVYSDLARHDYDHALLCLERSLRISRDLRPRGPLITQLVSVAIDSVCANEVVPLLLADPGLRQEQCKRLLDILVRHEKDCIDSFKIGIEAEYVLTRSLLRIFEDGIRLGSDSDGRSVETKLDRQGIAKFFREFVGRDPRVPTGRKQEDPVTFLASRGYLTPGSPRLVAERRAAEDIARSMLLVAGATDPERRQAWSGLEAKFLWLRLPGSPSLVGTITPDIRMMSTVCARDLVYIRGAICLVALRQWNFTHSEPSTNLETAVKAAGLTAVPIDPFSGRQLLLVNAAEGQFVYSIGEDGRDDRGLKDSNMGRKAQGDILFRMPKIKPRNP